MALENLGLINGRSGNSGYRPAGAAQKAPTIATFDQVKEDLTGIFATASSPGGNVDIAGDINLLQQNDSNLEAVTTAENLLFEGDPNWLNTKQRATLQQWPTAFFADTQDSSDDGETISSTEKTQLLATTLPSSVSTPEANKFLDRWNRTVQYWNQGIYTTAQVPVGQSMDFQDVGALQTAFNAALNAEQASQADGYSDPLAELFATLTQVQNDLAGMAFAHL